MCTSLDEKKKKGNKRKLRKRGGAKRERTKDDGTCSTTEMTTSDPDPMSSLTPANCRSRKKELPVVPPSLQPVIAATEAAASTEPRTPSGAAQDHAAQFIFKKSSSINSPRTHPKLLNLNGYNF